MNKVQIFQRYRNNSIQYEIKEEVLEVEVIVVGETTKSKIDLKSLGYLTATTRELNSREQVYSQRNIGLYAILFIFTIFAPIFIAGSNDIRFLDFLGAMVFILGIAGFIYLLIITETSKVRKKFIYFSDGTHIAFYYRNEQEIDEVEEFVSELNKVLKEITPEQQQEK
jgi:Na+/melibiose symporter-like transporter